MSGFQITVEGKTKEGKTKIVAQYFASNSRLKNDIIKREKAKSDVYAIFVNDRPVWKRKGS